MAVKINDLRRPWTVDDLVKTRIERLYYVHTKNFRFGPGNFLVILRTAEIAEKPPFFSLLENWVPISYQQSGLNVGKGRIRWDRLAHIEHVDKSWIYVKRFY